MIDNNKEDSQVTSTEMKTFSNTREQHQYPFYGRQFISAGDI